MAISEQLADQIRDLRDEFQYSHRDLAKRFHVSIRQVQIALNPEARAAHDRNQYKRTRGDAYAERERARLQRIERVHAYLNENKDLPRAYQMTVLREAGAYLSEIGKTFGVSAERARQILAWRKRQLNHDSH